MSYKKVGIEELKGWWVDYVVGSAICNRRAHIQWAAGGYGADVTFEDRDGKRVKFSPSTSWSDAGAIIEQFRISLRFEASEGWVATVPGGETFTDVSPLRAVVFALITSKVKDGYTVPVY